MVNSEFSPSCDMMEIIMLGYSLFQLCSKNNFYSYTCLLCCLKVLLPLVGIPMIEYSLGWLETAGIKQVKHYLEKSQWSKHPNITVRTIESHKSVGAGDALRFIYDGNEVCPIFFSMLICVYIIIS